jgi:hypothetical protein
MAKSAKAAPIIHQLSSTPSDDGRVKNWACANRTSAVFRASYRVFYNFRTPDMLP